MKSTSSKNGKPTRARYSIATDVACFGLFQAAHKDTRKEPLHGNQNKWVKQKTIWLEAGNYGVWSVTFRRTQQVSLLPANRRPLDPERAREKIKKSKAAAASDYLQAVADGKIKAEIELRAELTLSDSGWYWIADPYDFGVDSVADAPLSERCFDFGGDGLFTLTAGDGEVTVATTEGYQIKQTAAQQKELQGIAEILEDDDRLRAALDLAAQASKLSSEFWELWSMGKGKIKGLGYAVAKVDGEFILQAPTHES